MKKFLVVIVGWSGAGKTALAHELAKKHDFANIGEDSFVFDMNPKSLIKRVARVADRKIGTENMLLVLNNYMKNQKSIVVEGALVDGPIYLRDFEKIAEKNNYDFVPIMIIADEKIRRARKKKKIYNYVIPRKLDKRLIESAKLLKYDEISHVIDTTNLSMKKSLLLIEKILNHKCY